MGVVAVLPPLGRPLSPHAFRYEFDRQAESYLKLRHATLTVERTVLCADTHYALFAVLIHQGAGYVDSGHYFVVVKDRVSWLKIDDSCVEQALLT